jgi:hypothetical protein
MARSDQPSTGNGRTGGRKPAKTQVTVKTSKDTTLWDQTVALFSKKKAPKAPAAQKAAKPAKRRRNQYFDPQ